MIEYLIGIAILIIYFGVCASVAFLLRKLCKIPDEVFRKGLHFILLGSLMVFVFAFETWWIASLGCLTVVVLAYPVLYFCERFKKYSKLVTERKKVWKVP